MRYNYKKFKKVVVSEREIVEFAKSFDKPAGYRILKISNLFSHRINNHLKQKPKKKVRNPLLLGAYAIHKDMKDISALSDMLSQHEEIHGIETVLGTVHEEIAEIYGWERVMSESHTFLSEIDCAKMVSNDTVSLISMKSGPHCFNDTTANKIGKSIGEHCNDWATHWGVKNVEVTIGVVYSTLNKSNKKNWHAIRIAENELKRRGAIVFESCIDGKSALPMFRGCLHDVQFVIRTAQGIDLWDIVSPYNNAYLEICCALAKSVECHKDRKHNTVKEWVKLFAQGFVDKLID